MIDTSRTRWIYAILGLPVLGSVILAVMLITGYVPLDGFSHNPAHAARFGWDYPIGDQSLGGIAA